MRTYTHGHYKMAVTALRANRWRSFLTMFGVIVGVASVITVVSIAQGIKQQINGQINTLGKDLITVRANNVGGGVQGLGALSSLSVAAPLPGKDYSAITKLHDVQTVVPLSLVDGEVKGDQAATNSSVIGTTDALPDILHLKVAYGTFFGSDESDDNVAVLGQGAAIELFNENVPIGRTLSFRGQDFMVRGVLDTVNAPAFAGEANFNNAVLIPYNVGQALTQNTAPLYEILARPSDPKQAQATLRVMEQQLLKEHSGQHDFTIGTSSQTLTASNNILDLLTRLISGIAAISLVVGGIGIMNVMLVSVTERMREVGIRKAVGATNRQILNQFLIEATVLSLVGGILGIIVAGLGNLVIRILTNLQPVITWQIILLATGVSVVVGIIFGSVPAVKAARKQPIDALRNE